MSSEPATRAGLIRQLQEEGRRQSTSTVLFHHAIAEQMGLNPTDHKCLDIIIQRAPLTAGQVAEVTGLTTGTITAVLDRLEKGGFIRRVPDPHDRRKVLLEPVTERFAEGQALFADFIEGYEKLLSQYSFLELRLLRDFLRATAQLYDEQAARLRKK